MVTTLTQSVQELSLLVASMLVEAEKADAGTAAAGTRLRNSALEVAKLTKELRKLALGVRKTKAAERKAAVHA